MQKTLVLSFFIFLSFAHAATYNGTGLWSNSAGLAGQYQTKSSLTDKEFSSSYEDYYGKKMRIFAMKGPKEKFALTVNGEFQGEGSCLAETCRFTWTEGEDQLEENWIFQKKKLTREGKRIYSRGEVNWKDELKIK